MTLYFRYNKRAKNRPQHKGFRNETGSNVTSVEEREHDDVTWSNLFNLSKKIEDLLNSSSFKTIKDAFGVKTRGALTHPVSACVFRFVLRFERAYLCLINQRKFVENAPLCGKWDVATLLMTDNLRKKTRPKNSPNNKKVSINKKNPEKYINGTRDSSDIDVKNEELPEPEEKDDMTLPEEDIVNVKETLDENLNLENETKPLNEVNQETVQESEIVKEPETVHEMENDENDVDKHDEELEAIGINS